MNDRVFFDSNMIIYLSSEEGKKIIIVENKVRESSQKVISTQVLNEFINVSYKKNIVEDNEIPLFVDKYAQAFELSNIYLTTIKKALETKERYHYSYWDSLIIATALESNCKTLYSEDMHHGQVIDQILEIVNPFINHKK